jgi:hypothetical protein
VRGVRSSCETSARHERVARRSGEGRTGEEGRLGAVEGRHLLKLYSAVRPQPRSIRGIRTPQLARVARGHARARAQLAAEQVEEVVQPRVDWLARADVHDEHADERAALHHGQRRRMQRAPRHGPALRERGALEHSLDARAAPCELTVAHDVVQRDGPCAGRGRPVGVDDEPCRRGWRVEGDRDRVLERDGRGRAGAAVAVCGASMR